MFRGSVKGTGYPFHSPVSPSIPLPCVIVCHQISTGLHFQGFRLALPADQTISRRWTDFQTNCLYHRLVCLCRIRLNLFGTVHNSSLFNIKELTCTKMLSSIFSRQSFSTAGPRPGTGLWHQLYRAARGSPGICHFSFLSTFHE